MALKSPKIPSEVLLKCGKLFSSTAEAGLKSRIPLSIKEQLEARPSFRYKIANTQKPEDLPELNFKEGQEHSANFADLQPNAHPEYRINGCNRTKWAETTTNSPFPDLFRAKYSQSIQSDLEKADERLMKYKMSPFRQSSRHYSMYSTTRGYSRAVRGPAENSGSSKCPKKFKCVKIGTKKRDCKLPGTCPRFKLCDCEQSRGSNCTLTYLDRQCTKKFAPYPSYSEACTEPLPEDLSECTQCPWRTCDDVDTIKPGNPVRGKRYYSTTCLSHLKATSGVVVGPLLPPPVEAVKEHLDSLDGNKCGQTKPPCKQPPGPCEARRTRLEEEQKKKRGRASPAKHKKAMEDQSQAMWLANKPELLLNSCANGIFKLNSNPIFEEYPLDNSTSWIDMEEGHNKMYLDKKQKHPNCHRKRKAKRPKKNHVVLFAKEEIQLSDKGKRIKGDEGHVPPCVDERKDSLNCPPLSKLERPKKKKPRPLVRGIYKKPIDPYNKSSEDQ